MAIFLFIESPTFSGGHDRPSTAAAPDATGVPQLRVPWSAGSHPPSTRRNRRG
jgi:hypothetical protein